MFFSRVGSRTQEYTMYKARNTTDFPNPVKRFTKTSLFDSNTNHKASSWCLLRLSNLKTSHTFLNSSPTIFNTCHDFCVLPLQICKVKCDWFIRAYITEIVLVARVCRHYFWRNQWQPEIRLRLQANNVQNYYIITFCAIKFCSTNVIAFWVESYYILQTTTTFCVSYY